MESMLESKPFAYSMEDIRFGDDNAKAEKAKQSFLQLKQKICRTNDVIQQYSNKVKECDYLKGEVENAKKETEEWKRQHFASLAKILEMKTARVALEKSKKNLSRENAELETKIAGDQKHLQQLMCKLGDIEDQHSEKLMEIDLEKSGLQSRVAELEKEIKQLHKTYNVKKDDVTTKNTGKPRKGRKLKSPLKTSRSTGLLPDIDIEMKSNSEIADARMSSPQPSTSLNAILTRNIGCEAISTTSDLSQLLNVEIPCDESITPVKSDITEQIPTPKTITFDKNIMTDEFYGIKDKVYPLLCDKCEVALEFPVDKIFKIMTTVPPLLSNVPPSPIHSQLVDREIQTINIPIEANVSVQNDTNVSSVLDKVQQTLETLEKQMKKNNNKRRNDQNTIPGCNHTFPTNCCNHNNDQTLSQVNMMTSFWNSMMNFADKRLPKPRIKNKKSSMKKLKHRREMKKKVKNSMDSWIVESDTLFTADRDAINFTPSQKSHVAPASKYLKKQIGKTRRKNLFYASDNESEANSQPVSEGTDTNRQISSDSSSHTEDIANSVHNGESINSFVMAATSTPTDSNFVKPRNIMSRNSQNSSICSNRLSVEAYQTSRAQISPMDFMRNNRMEYESNRSCVPERDSTSSTPRNISNVAEVSSYEEKRINQDKNSILFNQLQDEPTANSDLVPPNTAMNLDMSPDISSDSEPDVNFIRNVQVGNSIDNAAIPIPVNSNLSIPGKVKGKNFSIRTTHTSVKADLRNVSPVNDPNVINFSEDTATITPRNFNFPKPESITKKVAHNVANDSTCTLDNVDPTSRKQMRPANVTRSAPANRNGLLQKLRRLKKDNKPVSAPKNTKAIDYSESTDEVVNLPVNNMPESRKRIAHVCKEISRGGTDIISGKRTNVTRSITKPEGIPLSESPESIAKKTMHSSTTSEQAHQETETNDVSEDDFISKSCGLINHDENEGVEITNGTKDLIVNKVIDNINSIPNIVNISDCAKEHNGNNNFSNNPNIESNIERDDSERVTKNMPISHPDGPLEAKVSSMMANEVRQTEADKFPENTRQSNVMIESGINAQDHSDCSPERMEVDCTITSGKSFTEPEGRNKDSGNCKNDGQVRNPHENSSERNSLTAQTTSTILEPNEIENTSLSTESSNSIPDSIIETYRKRRRTGSITKRSCEKTPESFCTNNSRFKTTSDKLPDELELILPKSTKKKSVPEIIQNEIGRYFNTKRVMTRSMKKFENLLSSNLDVSQKNKITPLKRLDSPRIQKITTPLKSTHNTPMNISKSFVKNLFSNKDSATKDSDTTNDNKQLFKSSIGEVETVDSITTFSEIRCHNMNIESEATNIYNSPSELDDGQFHRFPIPPCEKGLNVNENNEIKNSIIVTCDRTKIVENKLPSSELEIYNNDNAEKLSTIELTNKIGESQHPTNAKIPQTSPTFDEDSPLSPDPMPTVPDEYFQPPDKNAPLQSSDSIIVDSPYLNAVGILIDKSSQRPSNCPISQNRIPTHAQPPRIPPNYCNDSVRELRNRNVSIAEIPVPTVSKNDGIIPCASQQMKGDVTIKSLLENHFALIAKPEKNAQKFKGLAAKKASEEFVQELKGQMERFVRLPNWDTSIFQSVIDTLSKNSSTKSIARAIVDLIEDASTLGENVDHSHTPPAPLMTPSEQKIITLIRKLDEVKNDLIPLIFNVISHRLFRESKKCEVAIVKSLAKIYVALSKIKKDRQRVRILICDALYNLTASNLIIMHTALTSWAEVLPIHDENRCDHLSSTIVHIIKQQQTKNSELQTMKRQLLSLINGYYKYSQICTMSENIADDLLKELMNPKRDRATTTAILLLAKYEGTAWTYKHIIKGKLLRIIIENKNSSAYDALILLGYLMRCFPLQDLDGSVKNIIEQLCTILNAGTMPVDIQEGAVMALISLATRYRNNFAILKSILMWRPPRPLSPALQERMKILFKTRPYKAWCRIKI